MLGLLRRDLRSAGVEVQTVFAPGLPAVHADPVLIEQVLINLLRNALDEFAAPRAQPLRGPPRLRIAAAGAGASFVRIDVDDNGPGLAGRSLHALAEAFHSTKPDGMGMGLAICRSIVEAHHGGMEAQAAPQLGGARLSFTLPVHEAQAQPPVAEPQVPIQAAERAWSA